MYAAINPITLYIVEVLHLDKVVVPILGTPTLAGESGRGHFDHKQNSETIRVFVM